MGWVSVLNPSEQTFEQLKPLIQYYSYGIVGWLSETEDIMLRQTTQTIPVAALYAYFMFYEVKHYGNKTNIGLLSFHLKRHDTR